MCGIVGYVGHAEAENILVEGLARLEYRGYDSAGVATLHDGKTQIRRAVGKLVNLRARLNEEPAEGRAGLGHTRWATHGRPTEANAHPHHVDGITVVHNGIIENHAALRAQLQKDGAVFSSDTDTEIFAHLIARTRSSSSSNDLHLAVQTALKHVEGAYALAVLDERTPDRIVFAREASPLVVAIGDDECFLASDIPAVLAHTRRFIFLEDGDSGVIERGGAKIFDRSGVVVERPVKTIAWSAVMAEKGGHKHFMHKEIFEQPRAITDTLRGRMAVDEGTVHLDHVDVKKLSAAKRIVVIACGTSFHAGIVGRYIIESLARVPVDVELASEFRYRNPVLDDGTLVLAISQSGETADTLAALKEARNLGAETMAVANVIDSAIPRFCESSVGTLYTRAGPEIGVASTKAFTTQLIALHLLGIALGRAKGTLTVDDAKVELAALSRLPREVERLLEDETHIKEIARQEMGVSHMLYLGRGALFPIALEGALKLKEISYIHAEGYAAGEMKHGPIALIDETMPVVVLAIRGPGYAKVVSNLEEVRARGGRVIAVCDSDDQDLPGIASAVMRIPVTHERLAPVLATVPLQLLAYHIADMRGTDVDQPRNLAKSVTVE